MIIKNNIFNDERGGNLIPIEFYDIKFIPKRIFTVSGVPKNHIRGEHAHYETEQLLICVNGEILVGLDDGKNVTETILKNGDGIYINKMIWDYQQFLTGDEFMVVLSSTNYDPSDYINNKDDFYRIIQNEK